MYTGSFGLASNRADWSFSIELFDSDTGSAVDLTGASISIAISEDDGALPIVSGGTSDGKVLIGTPATDGAFSVTFPRSDMQLFKAGHYLVGLVLTLADGSITQLAKCNVAIVDGVVAAV